jgi:hypothetical protein
VHGPVGTARLAEFPGAVQRVDDPDPARRQPRRVVGPFLGEDHVTGATGRELAGQELVRQPIARLAQQVRLAAPRAQPEQPPARLDRQLAGQGMVVRRHPWSSSWSVW